MIKIAQRLIEIEGSDCSGKETQSKELKKYLISKGYKTEVISFPRYNNSSSYYVKKYLNGDMGNINALSPYEIARYYAEDRRISYDNEWHNLVEDNDIIIFDRYVDSNLIYQYPKFQSTIEKMKFTEWLYKIEFNKNRLPRPTDKILLLTPYNVSREYNKKRMNKINSSSKKDIHESNDNYMEQIYKSCISYCKTIPYVNMIITTTDTRFKIKESITQEIIQALNL